MIKPLSLCLTTTLAALALASAPPGQAQVLAAIDVPAGPLEPALLALGRQAGLSFAYDSALTAGRVTGGARGALSATEAVARVLAGTGLDFVFTSERAVRVTAPLAETTGAEGAILLDTIDVTGLGAAT